jgi:protein-tyrosine phosphatase
VLCTANQCRSPMAEVLLQARLDAAGVDARVRSAGELPGGVVASAGAVRAMAARGLALDEHLSQSVTSDLIGEADLVITMARRHLRAAVTMRPEAFSRTYTLKELARRAVDAGPRRPDQSLQDWLAAVHAGRTTAALLGDDPADDVADPMGGPDEEYEATAQELTTLIDRVVRLAFGAAATTNDNRETA